MQGHRPTGGGAEGGRGGEGVVVEQTRGEAGRSGRGLHTEEPVRALPQGAAAHQGCSAHGGVTALDLDPATIPSFVIPATAA